MGHRDPKYDVEKKGNASRKPTLKGKHVNNGVEKFSSKTINDDSSRKRSRKDKIRMQINHLKRS